jgi:polyisoprenyl-phosphate glycosyltransferase
VSGPTIWVVSPLYFDTEPYLLLQERVLKVLRQWGKAGAVHFVAVDDSGGRDPEMDRVRAQSDTTVVEAPFNLGHQRALVYGLRKITDQMGDDDIVVTLDADGEDRPEDIPLLVEPFLSADGYEPRIVLARRTHRTETLPFKALYLGFRTLFRALTGSTMKTGNFASYRGRTARVLLRHPHFDLCYSSTLVALEVPVEFVPCRRGDRYAGRSKMGLEKLLMHGLRMLMPFVDRIAIRSLVAFAGLFTFSISIVILTVVLVIAGVEVHSWLVAVALGVMAVSILALAIGLVLFAVFAQSRGISLSSLEDSS